MKKIVICLILFFTCTCSIKADDDKDFTKENCTLEIKTDYLLLEDKINNLNTSFYELLDKDNLINNKLKEIVMLKENISNNLKTYQDSINNISNRLIDLDINEVQIIKDEIILISQKELALNENIRELKEYIKTLNNEINNNKLAINQIYSDFRQALLNEVNLVKGNNCLNDLYINNINETISLLDDINEYRIKLNSEDSLFRNYSISTFNQEQIINVLNTQNDYINSIILNYESMVNNSNNKLIEYENYIKDLLNQMDLLNEKLNIQNNDMNFLIKTNNSNNDKYINEIEKLKILLNNEKENTVLKTKKLNVCLEDEKEYLLAKSYNEKQIFYKNIMFYIISLLSISLCFTIYKLKKL